LLETQPIENLRKVKGIPFPEEVQFRRFFLPLGQVEKQHAIFQNVAQYPRRSGITVYLRGDPESGLSRIVN